MEVGADTVYGTINFSIQKAVTNQPNDANKKELINLLISLAQFSETVDNIIENANAVTFVTEEKPNDWSDGVLSYLKLGTDYAKPITDIYNEGNIITSACESCEHIPRNITSLESTLKKTNVAKMDSINCLKKIKSVLQYLKLSNRFCTHMFPSEKINQENMAYEDQTDVDMTVSFSDFLPHLNEATSSPHN